MFGNGNATRLQAPKQGEREGQDQESTKAFGLTIPSSVLARADELIQWRRGGRF